MIYLFSPSRKIRCIIFVAHKIKNVEKTQNLSFNLYFFRTSTPELGGPVRTDFFFLDLIRNWTWTILGKGWKAFKAVQILMEFFFLYRDLMHQQKTGKPNCMYKNTLFCAEHPPST